VQIIAASPHFLPYVYHFPMISYYDSLEPKDLIVRVALAFHVEIHTQSKYEVGRCRKTFLDVIYKSKTRFFTCKLRSDSRIHFNAPLGHKHIINIRLGKCL
jgi:hypothetical protein